MKSWLIGSLRKHSFVPSLPATSEFGLTSSGYGAQVLNYKGWNKNGEKQFPESIQICRKQFLSNTSKRFISSIIPQGSDNHMVNTAAAHDASYPFEADESSISLFLETLVRNLDAFKRFICLHGLVATALTITSASLITVEKLSDFSPSFFIGMFKAIAACLLMQIYVVGVNQLEDIDIDKVNKPYRPLASGDFSYTTGLIITLLCSIVSFFIGWKVGSLPLVCALINLFMVGTVYSLDLPYLRWKKHAFLAAICIFSLRTPTPLAYYMHMQTFVLGRPAIFPKPLLFMLTFMCFFSIGLALVKDIPDIDGDKKHGIQSFAIRVGREKVFNICKALFQIPYLIAILVGLTLSQNWSRFLTVGAHMVLGLLVWSRANSVDLRNTVSTGTFYRLMWKLISLECFLVPLMR